MADKVELKIGDIIKMKKPHPCGTNAWEIKRVGMDIRLCCTGCNHQVMRFPDIGKSVSIIFLYFPAGCIIKSEGR